MQVDALAKLTLSLHVTGVRPDGYHELDALMVTVSEPRDALSFEPYAIVLPRGDWALRLMVNTALSEIYRDGRVATVFKNWFERVGLQMTPALRVLYGLGALSN